MKLQELMSVIPGITNHQIPDIQITSLCQDARRAQLGSVFVAIRGTKVDGHQFIPEAISKGAMAIVAENLDQIPASFLGPKFLVPNTRSALDLLAARFYENPSAELFCVGVTGTNGKTSTTYMIECILNSIGPTGVIGTVNHHLGSKVWPSEMTTPDSLYLQSRLREFKQAGAENLAMEVSSHALHQKRVESVAFNAAVFTNLTRDHLDYHKDMAEYFQAKQRLFDELLETSSKFPTFAIVNKDDCWGRRLQIASEATLWTYGQEDCDFRYKILEESFDQTKFLVMTPVGEAEFILPMGGRYNVSNAMAAIACGIAAGASLEACASALKNFIGVPGRLQSVPNREGLFVFVDYAHSPDALENVLSTMIQVRSEQKLKGKILTVFGCGGDRDKGKRPLMGAIASKMSDHAIVTSDNPRTEDPNQIIEDIMKGVDNSVLNKVTQIVGRKEAIHHALNMAKPGDVVVIAGKGHEDYQIVGTTKSHFSDVEVAKEVLK